MSNSSFQMKKRLYGDSNKGFTLVELMITVAILGVLAAVAIPAYSNYINRAKQSDAIIGLKAAQMAQEQYFSENGEYCSTINWLPGFNDDNDKSDYKDDGDTGDAMYVKGEDYYVLSVRPGSVSATSFVLEAVRSFNGANTDRWIIDQSMIDPEEDLNASFPGIKGYSVFSWLFD